MFKKCICLILAVVSFLSMYGCNQNTSTKLYNNITNNTKIVEKTISKMYIPANSELIIESFVGNDSETFLNNITQKTSDNKNWHNILSDKNLENYSPKYIDSKINSSNFNGLLSNLENLNLQMEDSVCALNELEINKEKLLSKTKEVNNKLKDIKNKKIDNYKYLLSKELTQEIEYLCNNLTSNDKVLKADIKEINKQKSNIILNTKTLSNNYVNIINNIENKIINISKICESYNQIMGIIEKNFNFNNHYISNEVLFENSGKNENNKNVLKSSINYMYKLETNNDDKPTIIPLPFIIEENKDINNNTEYL